MKILEFTTKFLSSKIFFAVFFGILTFITIAIAVFSFKWSFGIDSQIFLYFAFLTDKFNYLPYRDFFYFQMPGVHIYYLLIGKIFGYTYSGFRLADIIYLAITAAVTFFLFKKINWKVAWSSSVLFCLLYFGGKEYFSMQRDYVLIFPIAFSILIIELFPKLPENLRFIITGVLCSLASLIKPQAALAFPVILIFQFFNNNKECIKPFSIKKVAGKVSLSILGFMIPILLLVLFLWNSNTLYTFLDIETNFLPMTRTLVVHPNGTIAPAGDTPIQYITKHLQFGHQRLLLIAAIVGSYVSIFRSSLSGDQKRLVYLFIILTIVFNVHVAFVGRYLSYHWLPFIYCITFLGSLCFVESKPFEKYRSAGKLFPLLIVYIVLIIRMYQIPAYVINTSNYKAEGTSLRPGYEEAAEFLKQNLKPGDKVQSLDGNNSLASMLLAGAEPATYYVHEATVFNIPNLSNNEYFSKHRRNFIDGINVNRPKFILDFSGLVWFDELQKILDSDYIKSTRKRYVIYSRK